MLVCCQVGHRNTSTFTCFFCQMFKPVEALESKDLPPSGSVALNFAGKFNWFYLWCIWIGNQLSFSLKGTIHSKTQSPLNWIATKTRQVFCCCKLSTQFLSRWIFDTDSQIQSGGNSRRRLLTFPELFSLFGSILPLLLDDGQPGQVGPGLLGLPLAMELVVALFWLLLLNLLSFGKTKKMLAMRQGDWTAGARSTWLKTNNPLKTCAAVV